MSRGEAAGIVEAVATGGRIRPDTLAELKSELEKHGYTFWMAVEVMTTAMVKTIDNEEDALETIRRLKEKGARENK